MKEFKLWALKPINCSLFIILGFISGCQGTLNRVSTYERILDYSNEIQVINTHEHQHEPADYNIDTLNFFHLLHFTYLMQDLVSAGGNRLESREMDTPPPNDLWDSIGDWLDLSRNTSYYASFIKGIQKLYDFDGFYFTESNISKLSEQIFLNYSDFDSWYSAAFKKAGFEINSLTDYLKYCDFLFQNNVDHNAVCIKNSMAYGRSLEYDKVSFDEAERLYEKPSSRL